MKTPLDPALVGPAGEAFVEFDLLRRGLRVHRTGAGTSYDLIVEVRGKLWRVEVKATRDLRMRTGGKLGYEFSMSKTGPDRYKTVDVFAFVALDIPSAVYVHGLDLVTRGARKTLGRAAFADSESSFQKCFLVDPPDAPELVPIAGTPAIRVRHLLTGDVHEFSSVRQAVASGFTASGISLCLHGHTKTHRGCVFERIG